MKKAAPATSTAVARPRIALPVDIEAVYAAEAAEIMKRLGAPSGNKIGVSQAKTFKLPDGRESPGPISAVIVEFVSANYYYETAFVRGQITPAVCYAIGMEATSLVPSERSTSRQCDACTACWANQWESAKEGKGKACQNTRLLALLDPKGDMSTPLMIVKASATATKPFDAYVAEVARAFGKPPRGVITEISFDAGSEHASLRFGNPTPAPNELAAVAHARRQEALDLLLTEPELRVPAESANKKIAAPVKKSQVAPKKTPARV